MTESAKRGRTYISRGLPYIVLFVIAFVAYAPMIWNQAHDNTGGDYMLHSFFAEMLLEHGELLVPHPLLHAGMVALGWLLHIHIVTAGWLITAAALSAVPAIVYWGLRDSMPTPWAFVWSVLMALAYPIILWNNGHIYLGYLALTTYHNPTITLMKPFAVAHFIVTGRALSGKASNRLTVASAILIVLATLAKPSYTFALLPALCGVVVIQLLRKEELPWKFLIYGVAVPSFLLLLWQLYVTYISPLPYLEGKVIFAPLVAIRFVTLRLIPKLAMSIVFPAVVFFFYPRKFLSSIECLLAALVWLVGVGAFYLLAEAGGRLGHLNFAWGAYIANFLLFFAAVRLLVTEWLKSPNPQRYWRGYVALAVMLLHAISGVMWYVSEFYPPHHNVW